MTKYRCGLPQLTGHRFLTDPQAFPWHQRARWLLRHRRHIERICNACKQAA